MTAPPPRIRARGPVSITAEERSAVLANLYAAYATWVLQRADALVVPAPELTLIDSGRPGAELNIAYVESFSSSSSAVRRAAEFFDQRNRPWRLEAPSELEAAIGPQAEAEGLTDRRRRPAYLLRPDMLHRGRTPAELAVTPVTSADGAREFLRTLGEGTSGVPQPDPGPLVRSPPPGFTPYLGRVDGRPVATAALFAYGGIAGLYAVSTVTQFRGRGFGRAISERAIREAFAAGCSLGFLQSSEMAEGIYEAIGFRWTFDRTIWQRPSSSPDASE